MGAAPLASVGSCSNAQNLLARCAIEQFTVLNQLHKLGVSIVTHLTLSCE